MFFDMLEADPVRFYVGLLYIEEYLDWHENYRDSLSFELDIGKVKKKISEQYIAYKEALSKIYRIPNIAFESNAVFRNADMKLISINQRIVDEYELDLLGA